MSRREAIQLLSALGGAAAMGGCTSAGASGPTAVIVTLFDASASTGRAAVRDRYRQGFESILLACQGGERLMGDTITANSLASQTMRLDVPIPTYNRWKDNPLTFRYRKQAALTRARQEAAMLVADQSPDQGTDLLNAFQLTAKVFSADQNQDAQQKILIVFSDMIQQSARYDFGSLHLTQREIQRIIRWEQSGERLPNLRGVRVWVAGATASERGGLSEDQIYGIQAFWLAYFHACGADLPPAHYGAALLDFHRSGANPPA